MPCFDGPDVVTKGEDGAHVPPKRQAVTSPGERYAAQIQGGYPPLTENEKEQRRGKRRENGRRKERKRKKEQSKMRTRRLF